MQIFTTFVCVEGAMLLISAVLMCTRNLYCVSEGTYLLIKNTADVLSKVLYNKATLSSKELWTINPA